MIGLVIFGLIAILGVITEVMYHRRLAIKNASQLGAMKPIAEPLAPLGSTTSRPQSGSFTAD